MGPLVPRYFIIFYPNFDVLSRHPSQKKKKKKKKKKKFKKIRKNKKNKKKNIKNLKIKNKTGGWV